MQNGPVPRPSYFTFHLHLEILRFWNLLFISISEIKKGHEHEIFGTDSETENISFYRTQITTCLPVSYVFFSSVGDSKLFRCPEFGMCKTQVTLTQ